MLRRVAQRKMCGFIIGTVCLIALIKMLRHGRGCHGGGCHRGGGCGRGGWGHHEGHGHGPGHGQHGPWGGWGAGRFGGERMMLRMLFERLDTTPGQEKVIVAAVDEAREAMRHTWSAVRDSREDLARAMRAEVFDDAAIAVARSRHEDAMRAAHDTFTNTLKKVHEALDSKQRTILADLMAEGPFGARMGWRGGFGPGGPYRSA